ncbi:hypothetical protein LCGC14_0890360 [marine sediment metagenome]|uniref:DUF7694 domain-containing protein n=1 Tax=marine sediment metagenome TaxID=412755 RepID=A0A0F9RIS0_9ZZZZ
MPGSGIVLGPDGTQVNPQSAWGEWGFPEKEDLPKGWRGNVVREELIGAYVLPKRKLRVMLGIEAKLGSGYWIHLSVSHAKANPTHKTMAMCKKLFIGENREAIAIYPPANRHVNLNDFCLHLWSPMDPRDRTWPKMEKTLPDGTLSI